MSTKEFLCRICLTTNVFFHWTEAIFEFSGPSYKECYYHYTHLQKPDEDLHTKMLCLDCGNGLRNAYLLVDKAIASDLKLRTQMCEIIADSPLQSEKEELISVSVDMYEEQVITSDMENSLKTNTDKREHDNVSSETIPVNMESEEELHKVNLSIIQDSDSASESEDVNKSSNINNKSKPKKKRKTPLLCSYCSKTFNYTTHLINHEKTHEQNRERKEVCPICGLKLFNKYSLKYHMDVHDDNRERKYKCEFCPKEFFARGGLNIHRRIHLGEMFKCKFCPKEFYRQIDVDRHMKSHNLAPITLEIKPRVRSKYFRECDICGDKVNSEYWKHHKAKHLNQPTVQCAICSKTFFPGSSVQRHLKQCHGIASGEYENFLIKLDTKFEPRLSSLMIEQKIMKVYTEK